jgi:hypothetical protein
MTPLTNLGTNSASTKDWLEVTKNQSISEGIPHNMVTESSVHSARPMTAKSEEGRVSTAERFFGDLKKAPRRMTK